MYVTMVFHHPVPEHRESMLGFMYVGGREPRWTDRPDELFRLET